MDDRAGQPDRPVHLAGSFTGPPPRQRALGRMVSGDCSRLPPGSVSVLEDGDERTLRLAGEVDAATVDAFEESREGCHGRPGTHPFTVVDVSEVTFIDCPGLRLILRHTQATDEVSVRPVLLHAPEAVRTILELTGLTDRFDFSP